MRGVLTLAFALMVACAQGCWMSATSHQLGVVPLLGVLGSDEDKAVPPLDLDLYAIPEAERAEYESAQAKERKMHRDWALGSNTTGDAKGKRDSKSTGPGREAASEMRLLPPKKYALVRVAVWRPKNGHQDLPFLYWDRSLLDPKKTAELGDAYIIVDVSGMLLNPSLGAKDNNEYQRRLRKINELLLTAARHNGDTYWGIMIGELEVMDAMDGVSDALIGGGIPGVFVSPVVGATLTGAGLLLSIYNERFLDGLDVNDYTTMQEAADLYREVLSLEIDEMIAAASLDTLTTDEVLEKAKAYAFSFSIKGAMHAVREQNRDTKERMEKGNSAWGDLFAANREKANLNARTQQFEQQTQMLEAQAEMLRAQNAVRALEKQLEGYGQSENRGQGEVQGGQGGQEPANGERQPQTQPEPQPDPDPAEAPAKPEPGGNGAS